MTLDIWTAVVLILGVGIAGTGLTETAKKVARAFAPGIEDRPAEGAAYVLITIATCLGLTGWAAQPIGVPVSWAVIAGLVATACSAIVYRWFLGSFLRRGLASLTRRAVDTIESTDTEDPTDPRTAHPRPE